MKIKWFGKTHILSFHFERKTYDREEYILREILKKRLIQGKQCAGLKKLYETVFEVLRENFTEDNIPTTESFMFEQLNEVTKLIKAEPHLKRSV